MKRMTRVLIMLIAVATLAAAGGGCTAKAKKAYHLSRANRYFDAGQFKQAEIEYINTLHFDPANAQSYGRLGVIYYEQGRLQRAMPFLAKGIQMAPDSLDLRLKLGFICSSVGQFTQAVAQANYVLEKNPRDEEAPILLVEGSILPKDADAARQRLQTMAKSGDRAAVEVALGNLALRDRDVATAAAAYKKAQALDAKSATVNAALAIGAWAQGDLKQAETYFKAAADTSPPRSPRRMQYIRFKLQTGDIAGARTALEDILKAVPDYLPASMMLAEIAAAEKKYDECSKRLVEVLDLDPDNFDALFFQGQLELARGQLDTALADMERMARIYPQVPQVHYQLASAYFVANDFQRAVGSLNRALELNPNFHDATLLLAQIQIKNGNAGPGIVALERLRQKQPGLIQAQLLLADAYRMQNRVSDALTIYGALEGMYPTNAQVSLLHGAALMQLKDYAGARQALDRALQISPGNIPAIEQLVDLDIAVTNFDAAIQLLNSKIQKYPKEVSLPIMTAKVLLAEKKPGEAEAALLKALTIDPDSQSAHLLLAQMYSDSGQNSKALDKVNAAMAKDPQNPSALMLAASIYDANKDYKGAADAYEKLLKIDPKFSPAMNNLACLYSEYLNNPDRAYELAQRARELLPFSPSTADTLGWVNFKRGAYQAALPLLKDAAASKDVGSTPDVQYHFGMASYMTGDESGARAALQRALRGGTNFPGWQECERCLALLDINPAAADAGARATLEKRISEKADDPVALMRLARIYQREGNADKAVAAYEAILQVMPQNLDAMVNLTRLYGTKDAKKAYDMAKAASKLAPYDATVSQMLGQLAFLAGDYQLATSVLQQALQNQRNNPSLLFDYARAAYSVGRVSQAQTALQSAQAANLAEPQAGQARRILDMMALAAAPAQAAATDRIAAELKSDPNDVPAMMAQAAAAEFKADPTGAGQLCEKVLERYPDFTPAQEQLARIYLAIPGKLDRAYALAVKVHDTMPDDAEAGKILGAIDVQRADYSHAVSLLKQSAAKLGSDPEVFYYLGKAQYQMKNKAESKANLQQALALKLSGTAAESAKQMLNELK